MAGLETKAARPLSAVRRVMFVMPDILDWRVLNVDPGNGG
jgi:hypothetical protein